MTVPHSTTLLKILKLLVTLVRCAIGLSIIWIALALKVTEEGIIQNRLEQLSKAVDAKRGSALSKAARFVQTAARLTAKGFDTVFGFRLMSLRMVGVSCCLSVASLLLALSLLAHFSPKPAPNSTVLSTSVWFLFYLVLAIIPATLPANANNALNLWLMRLWAIAVFFPLYKLVGTLIYAVYQGGHKEIAGGIFIIAAVGLSFSILTDVFYIWATRRMLGKVGEASHLSSMLILIFGSIVLAAVLVVIPAFLAYEALSVWPPVGAVAAAVVLMMNSLDVFVCSVIFLSAFLMVVHRLLWPVVDRFIYSLPRYHIIERKKLLFTIGVAVILVPSSGFRLWAKQVIEAALRVMGIPAF